MLKDIKGIVYALVIIAVIVIIGILAKKFFNNRNMAKTDKLAGDDSLKSDTHTSKIKKSSPEKRKKILENTSIKGDFKNAKDIIFNIHNAKGLVSDNEQQVYSAFSQLKTKDQLEFISAAFPKAYGAELFDYLQSFLNEKEMAHVYDITKKLKSV